MDETVRARIDAFLEQYETMGIATEHEGGSPIYTEATFPVEEESKSI
jgi:hypothetical protein